MKSTVLGGFRLALVGGLALSIVACESHPKLAPLASTENQPPAQQPYVPPPEQGPVAEQPSAAIPGSEQDFVIAAGDRVYFDFDQYSIRPDAVDILSRQAQWLGRYRAVQVRIEGNCDERGTREYNFGLGARRANAVREFLINHGVDAGRITTVSYGKERPIDPGDNEDAWGKNRNAHTAIVGGAAGAR
jgi:peptidoglycan-associated lipoprotein